MIVPLLVLLVADGPIEVRARWLDPPPHFVSQTIGIEVTAVGVGDRATIAPSRVDGGDLTAGPVGTNSEGDRVATFRLTTDRAGPVRIPPFSAREVGTDRVGRGGSLSTQVRELPSVGRTRRFLGGVGVLEAIEAEAVPADVRVGESFAYRLRIVGKAAVGSTRIPDFSGWDRTPLGLQIGSIHSEISSESERTVTITVRATVPGEADLPSISVAAFDPKSQVYRTWRGPRVSIRVVAAPEFNPADVVYGPSPSAPPRRRFPWLAIVLGLAFGAAAVGLGRFWRFARRDPRRLASRAARSLDRTNDPEALANRIESALITYLERAEGRPAGALTPGEAREWVGRRFPEWADQADSVLVQADRARYSGRREACDSLRSDAAALFRALAGRPSRKNHGDRRQV